MYNKCDRSLTKRRGGGKPRRKRKMETRNTIRDVDFFSHKGKFLLQGRGGGSRLKKGSLLVSDKKQRQQKIGGVERRGLPLRGKAMLGGRSSISGTFSGAGNPVILREQPVVGSPRPRRESEDETSNLSSNTS